MKLHLNTDQPYTAVATALQAAWDAGKVPANVQFDKADTAGSRTHASAIDVHLVSDVKEPGSKRRRPNSGQYGYDGSEAWAATYDEWGWFLAYVFAADPAAKATYYASAADFHAKTGSAYTV